MEYRRDRIVKESDVLDKLITLTETVTRTETKVDMLIETFRGLPCGEHAQKLYVGMGIAITLSVLAGAMFK
jgi:hypothetical protein